MRNTKQTNTKPATKPAQAAHKGKGNPKASAKPADDETEGDDETGEGKVSKWAAERERAMSGNPGRAANRFAKLAEVIVDNYTPGQVTRLSFAKANELAGLRRGETGDPAASWRLACNRTRQVFGEGLPPVRVDGDASQLVIGIEA